MNNKILLASPHMGGFEQQFINEAFETNWIAPLGANVDNFEKEISEYVKVKCGAALSSGTAAIHMALKAIGIKKGDRVLCSALTFAASCNPIIYENAEPIFVDSERETWNMSPKALIKAFEMCEKDGNIPKALIVVHLYGQSADMDSIREICESYNCKIIEDAAESLGAKYKGIQTGTIGDYGVYSFNGNKIITTSGGGMVVSNNEKMIEKIRFWSTQSRECERHYEHKELGYNYRMSNVLAGIGRGQLKVLEERIRMKKEIYNAYKDGFKNIDSIEMMPISKNSSPNYWLSTLTIKGNSKVRPIDIMIHLSENNIESRPIWKPMNLQPFYKKYSFVTDVQDGIPVCTDIFNRGVCLPSDTNSSVRDIEKVTNIIKRIFK